ncbi:MAG TPA: hypothetical protein VM141_07075 [Planctomycetota bacterium]|nr:hypothetical protein [Planctomycetota bacterium]
MTSEADLESRFPGLKGTEYRITSKDDKKYNCIAWAAGDNKRWWEPEPMRQYYWPRLAPLCRSLEAHMKAFETIGYAQCEDGKPEESFEKIAIFFQGKAIHAAREHDGAWTSKIGELVDIRHELHALAGAEYGLPTIFMKRPIRGSRASASGASRASETGNETASASKR